MKMSFLLLLFLLVPSAPLRAGYMGESEGYIVLASIIGGVCTSASCLLWYFHQKVLKEDFFKKKADLQHRITLLEGALGIPLTDDANVRVIVPIQPLATGLPIPPATDDGSQEPTSPPPSFDAAWILPGEFFGTMPQDTRVLREQRQVGQIRQADRGRHLVGSLFLELPTESVSPVVMETAFPGAEEA